uniref:EF-hand domain-containing protein n=1 Tax=OCS116 cluster bacterium TaxID=2030921 RepID=A0A2A4ZAB8_9PROT
MVMKKIYGNILRGFGVAALLCNGFVALAAENKTHSYSPTTYASFNDIPDSLAKMIRKGMFQEQYISKVLAVVRQSKLNRNIINQASIDDYKERLILKAVKRQKSTLVGYDIDLDGFIDKQEIRKSIIEKRPQYGKIKYKKKYDRQFQSMLAYDLDNDGKISYQEMGTLSQTIMQKKLNKSLLKQIQDFLRLDPNDNQIINVVELARLANRAFATIDKDMNTIISDREYANYYNASSN